jgi:hypothetical protein
LGKRASRKTKLNEEKFEEKKMKLEETHKDEEVVHKPLSLLPLK